MKIHTIFAALNAAIRAAAQHISGRHFSRKSPLTAEAVIRFFISAEGGCLAKILHTAGPDVFRAVFDRFNSACVDDGLFRDYRLLAVDGTAVNLPRNPAAPSFVQNDGIPKGVNQLHATPLHDILNRTFSDVVI